MVKKRNEIEKWYDENKETYDKLEKKITRLIIEIVEEEKISYNHISGRVKDKKSYCDKAMKDKYKNPKSEITDMVGVRIIAYVNSDVRKISELIKKEFDIDDVNSVDKRKELGTDKVGYLSIHYIAKLKEERYKLSEYKKYKNIKFEIQIRTLLQHAWSEIEHDRNYKFSGKLPEKIKRKFYLLAGNLELIDLQFDEISQYIDKYDKDISQKVDEGNLNNVSIDGTSLKKYLKKRFSEYIQEGWLEPTLGTSKNEKTVIKELEDYGIKNMKELDDLLKIRIDFEKEENNDFLGILRDYMIINDFNKYFKDAWNENWGLLDSESVNMYRKNGLDVEKILEENQLRVIDDEEYEEDE